LTRPSALNSNYPRLSHYYMKIITDDHCTEYSSPGHPERPARITKTLEKLRSQKELSLTWSKPATFDEAVRLRAHTIEHVKRL